MRRRREEFGRAATITIGIIAMATMIAAQTSAGAPQTTRSGASSGSFYINSSQLPSTIREYLTALGDRLQTPGHERAVLSGTYSDSAGSTAAQLVWQAPGNVRLDRTNKPGQPLIYSTDAGLIGLADSSADSNLLESLLDDAPESFLYSFQSGFAHRFIGGLFRIDGGRLANYKGPWYEIHEITGIVHAQPNKLVRTKLYHFDSATKLLVKTVYSTDGIQVTTEFDNWINAAGQRFPGKIVRLENGAVVDSFTITTAATSPLVTDGLFSGRI